MDRAEQGRQNLLLGRWGESIVADDLRKKGWVILAAGYRCRLGEIDLIAMNDKYITFTEVKLRKDASHGTPGEAVTLRKQSRIRATAQFYLQQFPSELQPRFDVAEIYAPQGMQTKRPQVSYLENAF